MSHEQPILDFRPPLEPMLRVPVQGSTPAARMASQSGADAVRATWTARQARVVEALRGGPLCRQQLEDATGLKINAVCSVVGALLDQWAIQRTGDFDVHVADDGTETKRERFRLTVSAG